MKSNRLVNIEKPEYGVVLVKKSRGELSVEDVMNAIRDADIDDCFVMFFKATQFDGYLGDEKGTSAVLHNITTTDSCPVCCKITEEMYGQIYDSAFQDGYKAGKESPRAGDT